MSDVKFCDSCGTGLSINAVFCHKCGQKQVVPVENELPATDENNNLEPNTDTTLNDAEPETEKTEVAGENDFSSDESQQEDKSEEAVAEEEGYTEGPQPTNTYQAQTQTEPQPQPELQLQEEVQSQPEVQPQPLQQPVLQQQYQPQPSFPQAQMAQQAPYSQQAASVPPAGKKKFPWFFTVLWLIMFVAVIIWGYLYFVHPTYDYPRFTEDAQRFVLFTVSVATLIYTLSLKLSIKKLKAIPAILMVVLGLIIFVFFCLIELQEGDFLHDMVSNLVESVVPAFGE